MSPELRKRHGAYATPQPLVSFIARSVHLLLQSRFGLEDGLADRGVRVLDPAAGDMSFVIEAWRAALDHLRNAGEESGLCGLISDHLLPHFHGIELLPEACAEGRRAVKRFLLQQGFPLEPGQVASLRKADALAAPRVDLSGGIPVLLGNPPWSGYTTHQGTWICDLLHGYVRPDGSWQEGYFRLDGERLAERNVKWLQDDYVKFLRLAQWTIDQQGKGIVVLVVNHNCLDAPTFRGLRQSLVRTFNEVYALDLHGNRRKGEQTPEGNPDANVFSGVAQGAAVLFLVKDKTHRRRVFLADLYGSRREKLAVLGSSDLASMDWRELPTSVPCTFHLRCGIKRNEEEYRRGTTLPEIFPVHSIGVVTGRDSRAIAFDREEPDRIEPFLVRPFDRRFLLSSREAVTRPREAVMKHLRRRGNVALLALRQAGSLGAAAFVTPFTTGHKVLSGYFPNVVFPLYLFPEESQPIPNLSFAYCRTLEISSDGSPRPKRSWATSTRCSTTRRMAHATVRSSGMTFRGFHVPEAPISSKCSPSSARSSSASISWRIWLPPLPSASREILARPSGGGAPLMDAVFGLTTASGWRGLIRRSGAIEWEAIKFSSTGSKPVPAGPSRPQTWMSSGGSWKRSV